MIQSTINGSDEKQQAGPSALIKVLLRKKWLILAPVWLITIPAIAVIMYLPNRYRSDATLIVQQPQISQRYFENSGLTDLTEEVNTLSREVLSRKRLLTIIEEFGLFREEKAKVSSEVLAEIMRKNVDILPLGLARGREFSAFSVSFTADSPQLAQAVTSRLASVFIEENARSYGTEAAATSKFLSAQLEASKERVTQQEKKLRDFKMSNLGELPERQQANLSALTELRIELQSVSARLGRARQQKLDLESLLSGNIVRMQSEKAALSSRFTSRHPELLKKETEIERMTALMNYLRTGSSGEAVRGSAASYDPGALQLRSQIAANLEEFELADKEEQRLKYQIAQYQGRMNLTPVREQQLAALTRDFDLYSRDYTELVGKQLRSQMEVDLQEQQGGRHFRLIDPPALPIVPTSPKRLKLSGIALAAALAVGLILAFLSRMLDRSFQSEQEVRSHFGMPLVVGVPVLRTPSEQRGHRFTRAAEWVAAGAIILTVAGAEIYVYLRG